MSYTPKKTQTIDQRIVANAVNLENLRSELDRYLLRSEGHRWDARDTQHVRILLAAITQAHVNLTDERIGKATTR